MRPSKHFMPLFAALVLGLAFAAPAQAGAGGASASSGVGAPTGEDIAFNPLKSASATWYGPGLYGNSTACGQVLRPTTIGVAHKTLPCGTTVKFVFEGRSLITTVIDRGPYSKGYAWDLTSAAALTLGFEGSGRVRYAIAASFARPGH